MSSENVKPVDCIGISSVGQIARTTMHPSPSPDILESTFVNSTWRRCLLSHKEEHSQCLAAAVETRGITSNHGDDFNVCILR